MQRLSIALDGTVTGEHGIGLDLRDLVVDELGASTVDAMRKIKWSLDPHLIMNPGKMIEVPQSFEDGSKKP